MVAHVLETHKRDVRIQEYAKLYKEGAPGQPGLWISLEQREEEIF